MGRRSLPDPVFVRCAPLPHRPAPVPTNAGLVSSVSQKKRRVRTVESSLGRRSRADQPIAAHNNSWIRLEGWAQPGQATVRRIARRVKTMWSAFASSRSTCTSAGQSDSDRLMCSRKIASATQLTRHQCRPRTSPANCALAPIHPLAPASSPKVRKTRF
jgi:hypothetical protein